MSRFVGMTDAVAKRVQSRIVEALERKPKGVRSEDLRDIVDYPSGLDDQTQEAVSENLGYLVSDLVLRGKVVSKDDLLFSPEHAQQQSSKPEPKAETRAATPPTAPKQTAPSPKPAKSSLGAKIATWRDNFKKLTKTTAPKPTKAALRREIQEANATIAQATKEKAKLQAKLKRLGG